MHFNKRFAGASGKGKDELRIPTRTQQNVEELQLQKKICKNGNKN